MFDFRGKRVFVAGHRGMVGSAIVRRLEREECEILTVTRTELDLRDPATSRAWLMDHRPDVIFIAAAKVGGIFANQCKPADFIFDNLMIEASLIDGAHRAQVAKLVFLGSSCIYPKFAPQPIEESALLTGPLESTNEWYAVAKIAGIKLAQAYRRQHGSDFISIMPTNLYGPGDNYDLNTSHVLPALVRKIVTAKQEGAGHITIWGTGTPRREFLHVDDLADASVFLAKNYSHDEHINVGSGHDISIAELAKLIISLSGASLEIRTDPSKPDGTPRKLMSSARVNGMGWSPQITLQAGVAEIIKSYGSDYPCH